MIDKKILVVAAHPDDELLGCGGSISKWVSDGAEAYALILAEGLTARSPRRDDTSNKDMENLRNDARAAARIIGYQDIFFENFPDNRLDGIDLLDVVHMVQKYVDKLQPTTIFTHHHADLNVDHRIAFQSVITACRPFEGSKVREIYSFQIPSSTEWNFPYHKNVFSPNVFVNIKKTIYDKIRAMECYKTESRSAPHPRSPEALKAIALQWGSVVGQSYTEAFELIYKLEI